MGTNPMNRDTRNQGLVGMADGIPLFRDKHSRSVIPVMLRTANMGDHLSMKFRYTHLAALVPSHFWTIGEKSKQFERVERKPSHLCAVMHAVVDDLLHWEDGEEVEDMSKDAQDPDFRFHLRAMLLYWCGDYPGQGEASGFSHAPGGSKSCHWCEVRGAKSMAIDRQKYANYFRCVRIYAIYLMYFLGYCTNLRTFLGLFYTFTYFVREFCKASLFHDILSISYQYPRIYSSVCDNPNNSSNFQVARKERSPARRQRSRGTTCTEDTRPSVHRGQGIGRSPIPYLEI
jgi:hypothetical protein